MFFYFTNFDFQYNYSRFHFDVNSIAWMRQTYSSAPTTGISRQQIISTYSPHRNFQAPRNFETLRNFDPKQKLKTHPHFMNIFTSKKYDIWCTPLHSAFISLHCQTQRIFSQTRRNFHSIFHFWKNFQITLILSCFISKIIIVINTYMLIIIWNSSNFLFKIWFLFATFQILFA